MIERHYQLTLDFKVMINDITEESVWRDYHERRGFKEAVKDPDFWEVILSSGPITDRLGLSAGGCQLRG